MAKADGFSFGFDFALYVAFARAAGKRRRMPPVLRRRAIDALLQGMLFYYDPVTNSVRRSVPDLAKDCGLTTISANGSVSTGKATKALKFLDEILGFIVYTPGSYPSVSFTPALFEALNLFPQALAEARLTSMKELVVSRGNVDE